MECNDPLLHFIFPQSHGGLVSYMYLELHFSLLFPISYC